MKSKRKPAQTNNSSQSQSSPEIYPSAELYLQVLLQEYDREMQRMRDFDTKAGILLSAVVMLFTVFIGLIDFQIMLNKWPSAYSILALCSMISSILCIVFLMAALFLRKYNHFTMAGFVDKRCHKAARDVSASTLVIGIAGKIEDNKKRGDKKAINYTLGLVFLIVTLVLMVVCTLLQPYEKDIHTVKGESAMSDPKPTESPSADPIPSEEEMTMYFSEPSYVMHTALESTETPETHLPKPETR